MRLSRVSLPCKILRRFPFSPAQSGKSPPAHLRSNSPHVICKSSPVKRTRLSLFTFLSSFPSSRRLLGPRSILSYDSLPLDEGSSRFLFSFQSPIKDPWICRPPRYWRNKPTERNNIFPCFLQSAPRCFRISREFTLALMELKFLRRLRCLEEKWRSSKIILYLRIDQNLFR